MKEQQKSKSAAAETTINKLNCFKNKKVVAPATLNQKPNTIKLINNDETDQLSKIHSMVLYVCNLIRGII
jgi:hypothetical protein